MSAFVTLDFTTPCSSFIRATLYLFHTLIIHYRYFWLLNPLQVLGHCHFFFFTTSFLRERSPWTPAQGLKSAILEWVISVTTSRLPGLQVAIILHSPIYWARILVCGINSSLLLPGIVIFPLIFHLTWMLHPLGKCLIIPICYQNCCVTHSFRL